MATGSIAKLGKKVVESIAAYDKARGELTKLEKDIATSQSSMKSGDPSKMGAAAAAIAKLMPKLVTQQKKVEEARKNLETANAALAKAA